jgi:hypothetical protein
MTRASFRTHRFSFPSKKWSVENLFSLFSSLPFVPTLIGFPRWLKTGPACLPGPYFCKMQKFSIGQKKQKKEIRAVAKNPSL